MLSKRPLRWKTHINANGNIYISGKMGLVEVTYRGEEVIVKPLGGYSAKRFYYTNEKAARAYVPEGKSTSPITLEWSDEGVYFVRLPQPESCSSRG